MTALGNYSCTFCSLPSGEWGVRVTGLAADVLQAGLVLTATKRNGDTKDVTLAGVVFAKADAVVCRITDTRPVGRSRGYYGRSRPRGEQAPYASQNAPYDLAPPFTKTNDLAMTRAYEARRAQAQGLSFDAGDVYIQTTLEPVVPVAEVQSKVEAAGADDLAALFSSLLAQPSNLDPESTLRKQ